MKIQLTKPKGGIKKPSSEQTRKNEPSLSEISEKKVKVTQPKVVVKKSVSVKKIAEPISKKVPVAVSVAQKPSPKATSKKATTKQLEVALKPEKTVKTPQKSKAAPVAKLDAKAPSTAVEKKSKKLAQNSQTKPAVIDVEVEVEARALPVNASKTGSVSTARVAKPSARLAQITVPSMAQSVASTAAKASYLSNTPSSMHMKSAIVPVTKDPKLANNWKKKSAAELTDAEILAMPDSEYMNEKQLAFFRLKLLGLKQEMLDSAGQTSENLREDTTLMPDPADRATIEEEHALELRTRDRERKLLKKIEQSIQRIDAGDYGYCDETGEPIGIGRLLARYTATLSLEAQQRRELKQKMFGD